MISFRHFLKNVSSLAWKKKKKIHIYIWVLIKKIVERWVKVVLYWEVSVIQNGLSTLAAFIRLLFHWNWRAIHSIMNVSISLFSLGLTASYCVYQKVTDYFVRIKFRHCSLKKLRTSWIPNQSHAGRLKISRLPERMIMSHHTCECQIKLIWNYDCQTHFRTIFFYSFRHTGKGFIVWIFSPLKLVIFKLYNLLSFILKYTDLSARLNGFGNAKTLLRLVVRRT